MKISLGLVGFVVLTFSAANLFAQETTLTTASSNVVASKATIDFPGLSGNPNAIIVATPVGDTASLNPHPIGAWYYNDKWNIFNTDHANMPIGLKFKVEVYLRPDSNHFLHVVTKENLGDLASYIDNPALNNNPNAEIKIFQNHAPDHRANYLNKFEAKAEYDAAAGKWSVRNVNGERLFPGTAYNVVISSGTSSRSSASTQPPGTPVPVVTGIQTQGTMVIPSPAPLTVIAREQQFVVPPAAISISPGTCRFVAIYTNPNVIESDTVIVTGLSFDNGLYLVWSAAVDNGSVQISACNTKPSSSGVQGAMSLSGGRKINILVLR